MTGYVSVFIHKHRNQNQNGGSPSSEKWNENTAQRRSIRKRLPGINQITGHVHDAYGQKLSHTTPKGNNNP